MKKEKAAKEGGDKPSKKEKAAGEVTCEKVKKSKKEKKEKVKAGSEDATEPNPKADKKEKKSKKSAKNTETSFQWDSAILKAVKEAKGESLDVGKLRKKITKVCCCALLAWRTQCLSDLKVLSDIAKVMFCKLLTTTLVSAVGVCFVRESTGRRLNILLY